MVKTMTLMLTSNKTDSTIINRVIISIVKNKKFKKDEKSYSSFYSNKLNSRAMSKTLKAPANPLPKKLISSLLNKINIT